MSTPPTSVPSATTPPTGPISRMAEMRAALTVAPGRRTPRTWLTEGRRLTHPDRWLLCMLSEHTVLTAFQLQQLGYAATITAAIRRLRLLNDREVLYRFTVPIRSAWPGGTLGFTLGPTGAELIAWATGERMPDRDEVTQANQRLAASPRTRRRVAANGFFTTVAIHVRADPDADLPVWWSPGTCRPITGHPGDRYGVYLHSGRRIGFWYHHDNPDHAPGQAVAALDRYRELADATGVTNLIIGTRSQAREERLHHHLADRDWDGLTIVTYPRLGYPTAQVLLPAQGIDRVSLAQLPETPDLEHPYDDIDWDDQPHRLIPPLPPHPIYDPTPASLASLLDDDPADPDSTDHT